MTDIFSENGLTKSTDDFFQINTGVVQLINSNTGKYETYRETNRYIDGSMMTDDKVDGFVFRKKGSIYYQNTETEIKLSLFGGDTTGINDSSTALQKAMDFCIKTKRDLVIDGVFKIKNSIDIDRKVDDSNFSDWLIVKGGELIIETDFLFKSTEVSEDPKSQLFKFDGVKFRGERNKQNYIIKDNFLLRSSFVNCSFVDVNFCNASHYLQTIYFDNCQIRTWEGVWFKTINGCYDIRFTNCIVENGETFVDAAQGPEHMCQLSVNNCVIENLKGYGIKYKGVSHLSVVSCYFEGNKKGSIITDNVDFVIQDSGINIIGCYFHGNGENNFENRYYHVLIGTNIGGSILGNSCSTGNFIAFISVMDAIVYNGNYGDQTINKKEKLCKVYYGGALPIVDGAVIGYGPVQKGSVIYNTNYQADSTWTYAICIESGDPTSSQWVKK